jgi:hypothetical protein
MGYARIGREMALHWTFFAKETIFGMVAAEKAKSSWIKIDKTPIADDYVLNIMTTNTAGRHCGGRMNQEPMISRIYPDGDSH